MEHTGKTKFPVFESLTEHLPQPFVDEVSATEKYYGWAPLGVSETQEAWRIMKEIKVGNVTKRLYAQGSMEFSFSWAKRTQYSYSR